MQKWGRGKGPVLFLYELNGMGFAQNSREGRRMGMGWCRDRSVLSPWERELSLLEHGEQGRELSIRVGCLHGSMLARNPGLWEAETEGPERQAAVQH